jgi:ATP/maltotriose-dependent transcriptional regulator MalT
MLLADIAWAKGRATDGIEHSREAVRIAADEPVHARRVHPRLLLATALTDMRRLDEAEAVLQAATEEITARGHTAYAAGPCVFRARLRLAEGRLDDAAAEAETGLAMADEMGMHLFDPMGIIVLAIVALHRGDIDAGARHAGRCQSQDQAGHGPMHAWGWATWAMARIAEAQGDRTRAIEVLHAVFDDPSERLWLLMAEPDAAAWLIRTALVADRSGAEAIAGTAEDLSRRNPAFPTLAASAAQAYGILHEDAAALAYAAATHGGPWSRASAAEDLGVLLARRDGESGDDTVHRLDEALDGYQRIGALRDAARIRARLRGLGVRRPHWSRSERPVSGWASLTDTERSVAGLVAHGLTNPQVAGQMFISPHTVKFHLRQVFRKLGVASRVELARLAVEHPHDTPAG